MTLTTHSLLRYPTTALGAGSCLSSVFFILHSSLYSSAFGTFLEDLTSSPRRVYFCSSQRAYTSRPYQAITLTATAAFWDVLDDNGVRSTRNTRPCSAPHHTPAVSSPHGNSHVFFSSCPPTSSTPWPQNPLPETVLGARSRSRIWLQPELRPFVGAIHRVRPPLIRLLQFKAKHPTLVNQKRAMQQHMPDGLVTQITSTTRLTLSY
jgi:hypothetical protein